MKDPQTSKSLSVELFEVEDSLRLIFKSTKRIKIPFSVKIFKKLSKYFNFLKVLFYLLFWKVDDLLPSKRIFHQLSSSIYALIHKFPFFSSQTSDKLIFSMISLLLVLTTICPLNPSPTKRNSNLSSLSNVWKRLSLENHPYYSNQGIISTEKVF